MNWINGWRKGNKKAKYELSFRLGRLTVIEIKLCLFCKVEECKCNKVRFMLLNFGFEV